MTKKYHLNPETGNPGECEAAQGNCPFGADAPHYPDNDTAREAYEDKAVAEGLHEVAESMRASEIKKLKEEQRDAQYYANHAERNVQHIDNEIRVVAGEMPGKEWEQLQTWHGAFAKDSVFGQNHEMFKAMEAKPESFTLGERVMVKAMRWVDFGMLGTATGGAAGTAIFASQGRPGMAAIMGTVTALMSAPQWLPLVKAKVAVWQERRENEAKRPELERKLEQLKTQRETRVSEMLARQKQLDLTRARLAEASSKV